MKHPVLMTNAIDFHCYRCGVYIDSGDVWQTHCDRCAELERLEREIWRAVKRVIQQESELDALTARWRQLHAAGAEAATGGEEAR